MEKLEKLISEKDVKGLLRCFPNGPSYSSLDVENISKAIAKIGLPAIKPMIHILRNDSTQIQQLLEESIIEYRKEKKVERFIALLNYPGYKERHTIFEAFKLLKVIAIDSIIEYLNDSDPYIRYNAAMFLYKSDKEKVILPLSANLDDPNKMVRAQVTATLKSLGDVSNSKFLKNLDESMKNKIIKAIEAFNNDAIMNSEFSWWEDRIFSIILLSRELDVIQLIECVLKISFDDSNRSLVSRILDIVSFIKSEKAIEFLMICFKHISSQLHHININAIGKRKDSRAIPFLINLINDPRGSLNEVVEESLIGIGNSAVEPLIEKLRDPKFPNLHLVGEILGKIGDIRALEPLIASLEYSSAALGALSYFHDIRAIKTIIKRFKESKNDRMYTANSLCRVGKDVTDLMTPFLDSQDEELREFTTKILGFTKDIRAVEPLIKTLNDKNWNIHRAAVISLIQLGFTPINSLEKAFNDPNWKVRTGIAQTLEYIGKRETISLLKNLLNDSDIYVRLSAIRAIIKINSKYRDPSIERIILGYMNTETDVYNKHCAKMLYNQ